MQEYTATDETHFVDIFFKAQRPFTIWVPDNFDYSKMHKIAQERGICFVNTHLDEEGFVCQPQNSVQEKDSKPLLISLQSKA